MKSIFFTVWSCLAFSLVTGVCVAQHTPDTGDTGDVGAAVDTPTTVESPEAGTTLHWRKDPTIRRRPASYVGGSINYIQARTWIDENEDHKKLNYGPLHFVATTIRVGDAFSDKFAMGFQVQSVNIKADEVQVSAFALLLDLSFYPWKGLGVRPSAGFGFGFAQGKNKWEFGFGGPGTLAFSLLYEFRLTRKLTLAPVVTTTWITGDGFDSLFALAGIELLFWRPNRNYRHKK